MTYIKSHKKLKKIEIEVKNKRLTYHTYNDVKVGDTVKILGGKFKNIRAKVIKTKSNWDGYTYEARKVSLTGAENISTFDLVEELQSRASKEGFGFTITY